MSRKFLYRRSGPAVIVILGFLALMAPPIAKAQGRPQLKRPEQTTEEKLSEERLRGVLAKFVQPLQVEVTELREKLATAAAA